MSRPLVDTDRIVDHAYTYSYIGVVFHYELGKLEHYHRALDDIDTVIWRPYMDCEVWAKDGIEIPYVYMSRYLIGRTLFIIERFLHSRIHRQYGRQKQMPQGACLYAHR